MNIAYNMDCLEAMKQMPDNAFDLAVVDPPYGDGSQVVQVEREREQQAGNKSNADGRNLGGEVQPSRGCL